MSLEILALFAILLHKAQKALSPVSPVAVANEHQKASNDAAKQAADANARGDAATAAAKAAEAAALAKAAAAAAKAARTPPPWPQVVPADLAPFPGPGWQPANPVTAAQSARAWQLLAELWKYGEGTWKVEKTADRWVVYKAAQTSPGKKGVVAYTTAMQPATADTMPAAMRPQAPPVPRPPQAAPRPTMLATTPATPAAASGMPTLRLATPRMTGPSVVWLQQKLGIAADGTFGTGTAAAVRSYQSSHGLTPDGVVGKATWASLGVSGRAAA